MEDGKSQRSWKNYLIDRNFQLRYAINFSCVGMIALGLNYLLVLRKINAVLDQMALLRSADGEAERLVATFIFDISIQSLISFIFTIVFSFFFAIYMTHKVAGPAVAIERYIRDIKGGNFDENRQLRKGDSLQNIMAELRGLAGALKKRT